MPENSLSHPFGDLEPGQVGRAGMPQPVEREVPELGVPSPQPAQAVMQHADRERLTVPAQEHMPIRFPISGSVSAQHLHGPLA
jgi:hypothetical protein